MRKYLLTPQKNYYKANLHCHSTISDGKSTPQELKEMYMAHGYSIIAYTDHDVLLDKSDLCDENFLALNGLEMEIDDEGSFFQRRKTCHICFIALEPDNLTQFCYHREKYLFGNAPEYRELIKFDESKPNFERKYTPECINEVIAEGRKHGFFVTYNHPSWSLETLDDYGKYKGMNAMEICNYGSLVMGNDDYNEKEYDEMLRGGQKIFCIAADDNHRKDGSDCYGGFTVINADKLEYKVITKALEDGCFYASQGSEITEVWYEDGKMGIKCSAAAKIVMNTGTRRAKALFGTKENPLTSAVFDVDDNDVYVRLTVTDFSGNHANTSAYFIEDLAAEEK